MKHSQDNLTAATMAQAQAAAKQIAQLYATLKHKDIELDHAYIRIAELETLRDTLVTLNRELETKLDRANERIVRLHVALDKANLKNDMKGYAQ